MIPPTTRRIVEAASREPSLGGAAGRRLEIKIGVASTTPSTPTSRSTSA
jgi:hypothetical protein